MKRNKVLQYVALGRGLNYLRLADADFVIKGPNFVICALERLLKNLNELELPFSLKIAENDKIIELLNELKNTTESKLGTHHKKLKDIADLVNKAVNAEAEDRYVFCVNPKFINIDVLMDTPERIFGAHVWPVLDENTKKDFSEAALCLAFERHTASVMHLMRGVEAVLRLYYKKHIPEAERIKQPWMWGDILAELEKKNEKKFALLIAQLRPVKNEYRNESQHAGKHYLYEEAENVWHVCIEAINRMCKDL